MAPVTDLSGSKKEGDWSSRWSGRIGLKTDEFQGSRPQPAQETFVIPTRGHVDSTPEPTHLKLEFRREPFPETRMVVRAAKKVVDSFPLVSVDDEAVFVQEAVQMDKPQQPSHTHTHTAQQEEPPANTDWETIKDANGDTYYWNKTTNVVRRRAPGVAEGKLVRPDAPSWKDAVPFTLMLDVDFATIGDHEGFKKGIIWDVADAAKVDVKYVKIQELRAGSVIVDLLIAPEVGEPHKVLQDLRKQASSPGSRLLTGKLTSKTKGLATPAQPPAASSVPAKPEFKDQPIWHTSPAERAEEKQKQRTKEAAKMYPNGFPSIKSSNAVRYDTPWTLKDRWIADIDSYRYAEGQTHADVLSSKRHPDKYRVQDRAESHGVGKMYLSGVHQAARIRVEDRQKIDGSTFERALHMEDDGQAPGMQASAAVQDIQPPISVGMYRSTQKQVPDLKHGEKYISLADQGIRAEIMYGDSDRIDWIDSDRGRTIGGDLSVSSLSPQPSRHVPRCSHSDSEADWTHAEWLRAHPDAVSSGNGLQADMRFKLLEREFGGKVVQARKDSIFRTVTEPGSGIRRSTAEPQAHLYTSYLRSTVAVARNNDNEDLSPALPAGISGMRGGISGRVAHGDMSPYSSQSPNTSYLTMREASQNFSTRLV